MRAFETVFRMNELGRSFSGYERNRVFLNTGSARFADVSASSGLDFLDDGRGLARVDWDLDGDLDLWLANRTAPQLRLMRNELANDNHFLALHLEGRSSNRDAVGARVEVRLADSTQPSAPLIQTLRAGEGFLSQSSKWLHFGLGGAGEIDSVVVRWPAGGKETLRGVEADRRYVIVEGSGVATEIELPAPLVVWPQPAGVQSKPARERAFLTARVPLPLLEYTDTHNRTVSLNQRLTTPTLVNLWATWCQPCVRELEEVAAAEGRLRAANLDFLALSVDGLGETAVTRPQDAQRFLASRSFPFSSGFANAELLSKLQVLHDRIFSTHVPLAVPTSMLIDAHGNLAAFYRGAIEVEQVLEDLAALDSPAARRREKSTPFSGRWFADATDTLPLGWIAQRFLDDGFDDDAIRYLEKALEIDPQSVDDRINLAHLLLRRGDVEAADGAYRGVLALAPRDGEANRGLADLLAEQGRNGDAVFFYKLAAAADFGGAETRYNYGNALQRMGQQQDAMRQFEAALEIDPSYAEAHNNLGALLFNLDRIEQAVEHFRNAVALAPGLDSARDNLESALRAAEQRH